MLTYNKKVIQLPSEEKWTFWDFSFWGGSNPIEEWYQSLSEEGMFRFDSLLKVNHKTALPINWVQLKFLKGKLAKHRIWELRFFADGRQYRVLGNFGEDRKRAILLLGCYHKGGVYEPPDALEQAVKRARMLTERKATCYERPIKDDI